MHIGLWCTYVDNSITLELVGFASLESKTRKSGNERYISPYLKGNHGKTVKSIPPAGSEVHYTNHAYTLPTILQ